MVVRKTPTTTGYVITPGFAQQALEAAKDPKHNGWVDILFEVRLACQDWRAAAAAWLKADSGPWIVPQGNMAACAA